jgi:hypothetical protein
VTEGTGWAARFRRVLNARLEEMSFRSGAAVFGAVLALTGLGLGLSLTEGGSHHPAAASAVSASVVTRSPASGPSPASAAPSPSPSVMHDAPENVPAQDGPQSEATTRAAAPRVTLASSSPWPTPRPIRTHRPGSGGPGYPPPGWWPPWWP